MRKTSGSLYEGKDGRKYLAAYSYYHDVYTRPLVDMSGLERIAHVSYSKEDKQKKGTDKQGSIDIFLITNHKEQEKGLGVKKTFHLRDKNILKNNPHKKGNSSLIPIDSLKDVDKYHDVQAEVTPMSMEMEEEIMTLARTDIMIHCERWYALSHRGGEKRQVVDKIIPHTLLERKPYIKKGVLQGGKQEFVGDCLLDANLDFTETCLARFIPGEGGGSFDGTTFTNYFDATSFGCFPCYAERFHFPGFAKRIFDLKSDLDRLKAEMKGSSEILSYPLRNLRLGKRTEAWTPFTHEEFMIVQELMAENKIKGIMPTKFFPYMKEVKKKLLESQTRVLYSTGFSPIISPGVHVWEKTDDWKIDQALQYGPKIASIYPNIIAHLPPTDEDIRILTRVDWGRKIPVQLLPIRFGDKKLTRMMCGEERDVLADNDYKGRVLPFADSPYRGTYSYTNEKQKSSIVCEKIHPDWLKLVGNNTGGIRMCHHNSESVYCGGCSQAPGGIYPIKN